MTSILIDSTLPIVKSIVKLRAEILSIKQKCSQFTKTNSTNKHAKKI